MRNTSSGVVYGGHLATRSYARAGQGQDGWDDEVAYLEVFLLYSVPLWSPFIGNNHFRENE